MMGFIGVILVFGFFGPGLGFAALFLWLAVG